MDRQIVYPGSIPLDTDLLSLQRNAMVALGYLAQATLGSSTVVDGLACSPTAPASLTVSVGPGSITSLSVIDATPSARSRPTHRPARQDGHHIRRDDLHAHRPRRIRPVDQLPGAGKPGRDRREPGRAALLQRRQPGPALQRRRRTTACAQNTQRLQRVQFQLKPSPPANAGAQVTPPVDTGWVGLYVITVNYGQTQITAASIAVYPGAPFIAFKLNTLTPGFSRLAAFPASGSFTVPNGSTR